jgi:hypothetical protein
MSAAPKIIEGTWDEVLLHAHELAGHRLRVMVMEDSADSSDLLTPDSSPAERQAWAQRFRKWALDRPPLSFADDSRDAIYEDYLK